MRDVCFPGRGSPTPVAGDAGHEESPPTGRTGDRAQARSRRRLALEQKRHPPIRPMRCVGCVRGRRRPRFAAGARTDPRGKGVNPPRAEGRYAAPLLAGFPASRRSGTDGTANPRRCKPALPGGLAAGQVVRPRRGRSAEFRDEQKGAYSPQPLFVSTANVEPGRLGRRIRGRRKRHRNRDRQPQHHQPERDVPAAVRPGKQRYLAPE